jgi:hypothetical protein
MSLNEVRELVFDDAALRQASTAALMAADETVRGSNSAQFHANEYAFLICAISSAFNAK